MSLVLLSMLLLILDATIFLCGMKSSLGLWFWSVPLSAPTLVATPPLCSLHTALQALDHHQCETSRSLCCHFYEPPYTPHVCLAESSCSMHAGWIQLWGESEEFAFLPSRVSYPEPLSLQGAQLFSQAIPTPHFKPGVRFSGFNPCSPIHSLSDFRQNVEPKFQFSGLRNGIRKYISRKMTVRFKWGSECPCSARAGRQEASTWGSFMRQWSFSLISAGAALTCSSAWQKGLESLPWGLLVSGLSAVDQWKGSEKEKLHDPKHLLSQITWSLLFFLCDILGSSNLIHLQSLSRLDSVLCSGLCQVNIRSNVTLCWSMVNWKYRTPWQETPLLARWKASSL